MSQPEPYAPDEADAARMAADANYPSPFEWASLRWQLGKDPALHAREYNVRLLDNLRAIVSHLRGAAKEEFDEHS